MKTYKLYQVDAFTETRFGGNPCAVVMEADSLTSEEMQKIATEMNLSETAFVVKSDKADFGARYFTPQEEIPMAGHPTISTIFTLIQNGDIVLNASMPITSALKTTGIIVLNINDYTTNKSTNKSITDWSKVITSQINNINNVKNQLDQFMISGFENVPEQKGILNCISALTSICDSVIKDIEDLNTLSIPDFGTCVGSKNGSPQDAVDALSQAHITQQAEINKLKLELENQNKEINNLRGFYSSIVNDQSGGTLSTQNIGTNTDGTVTVIKGGCGAGGTCP